MKTINEQFATTREEISILSAKIIYQSLIDLGILEATPDGKPKDTDVPPTNEEINSALWNIVKKMDTGWTEKVLKMDKAYNLTENVVLGFGNLSGLRDNLQLKVSQGKTKKNEFMYTKKFCAVNYIPFEPMKEMLLSANAHNDADALIIVEELIENMCPCCCTPCKAVD